MKAPDLLRQPSYERWRLFTLFNIFYGNGSHMKILLTHITESILVGSEKFAYCICYGKSSCRYRRHFEYHDMARRTSGEYRIYGLWSQEEKGGEREERTLIEAF